LIALKYETSRCPYDDIKQIGAMPLELQILPNTSLRWMLLAFTSRMDIHYFLHFAFYIRFLRDDDRVTIW